MRAYARRTARPAHDHSPERVRESRQRQRDLGSISIWVVIFAFTTIFLLVLVVDGGQTMNAKSRAADIAEQAARAQLNDLNVGSLRAGKIKVAGGANSNGCNPLAVQMVQSYTAGASGETVTLTKCTQSVTDVGGTPSLAVTATVQLSVRPAMPVPPFTTINETAQEIAYLACGSADQREAC